MPQAARLADPIGHSPSMNWLLAGVVAGAAIAVAGVAIVGTGGLAAAAIVGGAAAMGGGLGETLSAMSWAPKEVCGTISGTGSTNVFINNRPAGRAHVDLTLCGKHAGIPLAIATGSGTVFINGFPATRVGDQIACGAVIVAGSGNVHIGGVASQTDPVSSEDIIPGWVHASLLLLGAGSATAVGGPLLAIGGFASGLAGAWAGNWAGSKVFGQGSDAQKWAMLGGSAIGGLLGVKGLSFGQGRTPSLWANTPAGIARTGGQVASTLPEQSALRTSHEATERAASSLSPAWHATRTASAASNILDYGIDPAFLNPNSRFGSAFYVAEQPTTALAEMAHYGVEPTTGIRFQVDQSSARVLDLTDPTIAEAWGYKGGNISSTTQKIGQDALAQGYNTIRFKSERANSGTNLAVLNNFNEILKPVMVSPVKP